MPLIVDVFMWLSWKACRSVGTDCTESLHWRYFWSGTLKRPKHLLMEQHTTLLLQDVDDGSVTLPGESSLFPAGTTRTEFGVAALRGWQNVLYLGFVGWATLLSHTHALNLMVPHWERWEWFVRAVMPQRSPVDRTSTQACYGVSGSQKTKPPGQLRPGGFHQLSGEAAAAAQ